MSRFGLGVYHLFNYFPALPFVWSSEHRSAASRIFRFVWKTSVWSENVRFGVNASIGVGGESSSIESGLFWILIVSEHRIHHLDRITESLAVSK